MSRTSGPESLQAVCEVEQRHPFLAEVPAAPDFVPDSFRRIRQLNACLHLPFSLEHLHYTTHSLSNQAVVLWESVTDLVGGCTGPGTGSRPAAQAGSEGGMASPFIPRGFPAEGRVNSPGRFRR